MAENELEEKMEIKHVPWTEKHENILVEWADKAMSYRWLHRACSKHFYFQNAAFTIPVIVLSTLTGTANFATEYLDEDTRRYFPLIVGSVNIIAGILGTVHQFLKISELNENHRISYIAWDKYYRNIKLELSQNPSERTSVHQIMKYSKEEFDRLMETSPPVLDKVIKQFKSKFSEDIEFIRPDICDELTTTRNVIYKKNDKKQNLSQFMIESVENNNGVAV